MTEHGRPQRYKDGCRCDACKAGNNERARLYNKRRRLGLPKSPAKVAAGKRGSTSRWGDHVPSVIYLHDMTEQQRLQVVEFVASLRTTAGLRLQ